MLLQAFHGIRSERQLRERLECDLLFRRGRERVNAAFTMALAAYNLIRLPKLLAVTS